MATQRTDGNAVISELLLEGVQLLRVVQHGQLAMRIARIITGAQFDGGNSVGLQLLQDIVQRHLRQQRGEDSDSHKAIAYHCGPGESRLQRGVQHAKLVRALHGKHP